VVFLCPLRVEVRRHRYRGAGRIGSRSIKKRLFRWCPWQCGKSAREL
jgi:hypothetical protein